jgi:hypothetical protein
MIYTVKARYIEDRLIEFYEKLLDGTILDQKPDGKEIVNSMHRAKITSPGVIEWSEKCFCPTPLKHERETVYDYFLTDIETIVSEKYADFDGEPFMNFLSKQ